MVMWDVLDMTNAMANATTMPQVWTDGDIHRQPVWLSTLQMKWGRPTSETRNTDTGLLPWQHVRFTGMNIAMMMFTAIARKEVQDLGM